MIEIGAQIAKNGYLIMALYVLIGGILMRQNWKKTMRSVIRAAIGVILLTLGGEVIMRSLVSLTYVFQRSFRVIGILSSNERLLAYTDSQYGGMLYGIMLVGMAINVLMARFTRFKYVFLAGHQVLFMSGALAAMATYLSLPPLVGILSAGILLGVMMTIFPHLIQPYTERITGKKEMAVGHFSSMGFLLSAWIGKVFHKEADESIKRKSANGFLDDHIVATAIFMVAIFLISALFAKRSYVEDITGGNFYLLFALEQGLTFTGGVYIIINGVRLIIQEIMPIFQQVAKRFVPNAIPALDVSMLFVYQRGRLMLGFVGSLIGGILAMFVLGAWSVWVIIPSSTVYFFSGSASGLYGYSTGGKRGAILSSVLFGFALGALPILTMRLLSELGFYRVVFPEIDFQILAGITMGIKRIFQLLGFAG